MLWSHTPHTAIVSYPSKAAKNEIYFDGSLSKRHASDKSPGENAEADSHKAALSRRILQPSEASDSAPLRILSGEVRALKMNSSRQEASAAPGCRQAWSLQLLLPQFCTRPKYSDLRSTEHAAQEVDMPHVSLP